MILRTSTVDTKRRNTPFHPKVSEVICRGSRQPGRFKGGLLRVPFSFLPHPPPISVSVRALLRVIFFRCRDVSPGRTWCNRRKGCSKRNKSYPVVRFSRLCVVKQWSSFTPQGPIRLDTSTSEVDSVVQDGHRVS